jgi:hypothetical protein
MQWRTLTRLSELRVGDIFHYPKQEEKFQVTDQTRSHTSINKPDFNGGFISKYDEMVKNTKQVIFLRHTRPEPGEQCLVQDLRPGEVFHTLSDVITEYEKDINGKIVRTDSQEAPVMKKEDRVVFVRKQY